MSELHPHHECLRDLADGGSVDNWQCFNQFGFKPFEEWRPLSTYFMAAIVHDPNSYKVRRVPQARTIDWTKLDVTVPVIFWDFEVKETSVSFLKDYRPEQGMRFDTGYEVFECASLRTDRWVPNVNGENPWPEGVIVEVAFRDDELNSDCAESPASEWVWSLRSEVDDIIMSRFHSLEDGYTFGSREA